MALGGAAAHGRAATHGGTADNGASISRRTLLRGGLTGALAAGVAGPAGLFGWQGLLDRTFEAMAAAPSCPTLRDIEHVVFVIQENRSFDHYFGRYPGVRGFDDRSVRLGPGDDGTQVFRQANPGQTPNPVLPFHVNTDPAAGKTGECIHDIGHQWIEQHQCWDGGRLDGYVKTHVADEGPVFGPLTMGYYDRRDLPFYYALADAFTICDHYHTSVISGTIANRIMGLSGTIDPDGRAGGPVVSTPETTTQQENTKLYAAFSWKAMPEVLQAAGVSWRCYNPPDSAVPLFNDNYLVAFKQYVTNPVLAEGAFGSQTSPDDFAADCRAGRLPSVSWVNVQFLWTEHPPTPVGWGQYGISRVLSAVLSNPELWAKTAVFVTWDDSGSFFDHVPPPVAPPGTPGEYLTAVPPSGGDGGIKGPIGLGPRVPMLVISPWSRNGGARSDPGWGPLVCSDTLDHTSMLRFLEPWLAARGIPGVAIPNDTAWRRSTVGDLTGAFSFGAPELTIPALPATSLVTSLTYPECEASPGTEIPTVTPPLAYLPDLAAAAIPAQEDAATVRRPSGLAACAAAAGGGGAGAGGVAAGNRLAATGLNSSLERWALVAGGAGAALLWLRRRAADSSAGLGAEGLEN